MEDSLGLAWKAHSMPRGVPRWGVKAKSNANPIRKYGVDTLLANPIALGKPEDSSFEVPSSSSGAVSGIGNRRLATEMFANPTHRRC